MQIKIGTRGSQLALWQAYYVADLLKKGNIETEIVIIETKGDKILDKSLSKIGSKGVFTEELEEQLRNQSIDIAVHSAKDVQSELTEDLTLLAFTEREIPCDVLISLDKDLRLANFASDKFLGTSSTRRVAMLKHYYPTINTADVRGNLQTRLKKLQNGDYKALMLAYAGVHRMNFDEYIVEKLPLDIFTPAVGQGSVAIQASQTLSEDKKMIIRQLINHPNTETCLLAERSFLKTLQGGCSVPVFGLATWEANQLKISGGVISLDGKRMLRQTLYNTGEEPIKLGQELAESLLNAGADKILAEIKQQQKSYL